jgi:hypothetical protein
MRWSKCEICLQGDFTAESLIARACEEYDTTPEEAEAYVKEFLEQLDKEGVIEK